MSIKIRNRVKVVLFILLLFCNKGNQVYSGKFYKSVFVEVDTVKFGRLERRAKVWCIVEPSRIFYIVSDVSGIIDELDIKVGDYVKKGDTVAKVYRGPHYSLIPIISFGEGRVERLEVGEGSPVNIGSTIAVVSGGGSKVKIFVPLSLKDSIKRGSVYRIGEYVGRIIRISNIPDKEILSYIAWGTSIPSLKIGPYMCELVVSSFDSSLYIPSKAIKDNYVFKINGHKAHKVKVKPLFKDDFGNTAIKGDLKVGDTIVVLGIEMLKDTSNVIF